MNSNPSSATVTVTPLPGLALLKTAAPSTVGAAGRTVTYSFQVTNTGNTVLTSLSVADTVFTGTGTPPVITCPVTTLTPGQVTTCTGTYVTTQPDVGNGGVLNTAVATGTPPSGPPVNSPPSSATVTIPSTPRLDLQKTAAPATVTEAGQTVTYSYRIVNSGNRTMNGIGAIDTAFSGTGTPPVITCPVSTLAPNTSTTCTGTYVVTQLDIDTGTVVNTARAFGTPPGGPLVVSDPSTATVTAESTPSLALLKTASPSTVAAAGLTVFYSYQVTNTGNTTLLALSVADTSFTGTGPPPVITCPVTVLLPDEVTTCTGTYVTTQADVNAGSIVDAAVATGTTAGGVPVASGPSIATVTIPSLPHVELLKTAFPSSLTAAGQVITYSFRVTNTGNTTLTGVTVADVAFSGTGTPPVITCPVTTLTPGQVVTCTGTYVVTQEDVNSGALIDTALATGTPPTGGPVTSDPSTATVSGEPAPHMELQKTVFPSTLTFAGRTVTYSYTVTNTGNVTLTALSVADTAFSGTGTPPVITCPVTSLDPGVSTTCTGTYVTTQADVDAGAVINTALATGTPPVGGPITSDPATATLTFLSAPSMALSKSASPPTVTAAGQTVVYSYAVANTGNTTLTGVTATDTAFSGTGTPPVITCPVTTLAPQAATTCTGTYVVTQADINAGSVVNTAVASGTPPEGPAISSPPSTATVTVPPLPSIGLLKTAFPSTISNAGRPITYSYTVTNTGNTTLTNVAAADTAFSGTGPPPVVNCPVTTLAPQASTTCTGTYVTTQADLDAGVVVNTAVATGTPPQAPPITSPPSTVTVTMNYLPSLALSKSASPVTVTQAGQTVTYSYAIVNTGNKTLTGVTAADTAFSGTGTPPVITCPVTTLAPGATTTCTGTYAVTQADIDAGAVVNTAVARGTPPTGPVISSAPSTATVTAPPQPGISVLKTASPSTVGGAGTTITYSFQVTDTGNTTLTGVSVADTAFSGTGPPPVITCPVTTLEPGESTTCTGTYVTTQADVDSGALVDTAVATGTPPEGPPITSPPSTVTVTIPPAPSLALNKSASPATVTAAGQTVTYSYAIVNTGNTTLTQVTAADTAFSGTGTPPVITCPVTTLAPQAGTTCTGTYVVTQLDIDAGVVLNTAVASGTPPEGAPITSAPSTATVTAASLPSVSLQKTAQPSTVAGAGLPVVYHYRVTNTGNTT
ncbi:beta strand repeat-containing protein, partial [Sphaerisporangium rufum]|uniref:beta strand repeat-containing protein n=1 Tax=Sphaerisporangium rufum TaxID=1381558 RepID=UPI00195275B9